MSTAAVTRFTFPTAPLNVSMLRVFTYVEVTLDEPAPPSAPGMISERCSLLRT